MSNTFVIDIETQNHRTRSGAPGGPQYYENYMVSAVVRTPDDVYHEFYYESKDDMAHRFDEDMRALGEFSYCVAHNAGYEYAWLTKFPVFQEFLANGGTFIDTMYVEYSLAGYGIAGQMKSLNELSAKYGGSQKVDVIKALWEEGVLTADIDKDLLMEYNVEDVKNTSIIWEAQKERLKKEPAQFRRALMAQMRGLHGMYEMQVNGMYVDTDLGLDLAEAGWEEMKVRLDDLKNSLPEEIRDIYKVTAYRHKSALLYGGPIPREVRVNRTDKDGNIIYEKKTIVVPKLDDDMKPVIIKSGQKAGEVATETIKYDTAAPQTKKGVEFIYLPRQIDPELVPGMTEPTQVQPDKKTPIWATGQDIMDEIPDMPELELFQSYSTLANATNKHLITEDGSKGMLTKVNDDSFIYPSILTCKTATGRVSHSPNVSNPPRLDSKSDSPTRTGVVRTMYKSRFDGGKIIELDYSALEDRCLAASTQDPQYVKDVND